MIGEGTVQFDIGGTTIKVLEQTIRAKPDTLLCTLLDDPGQPEKSKPIFVEGDPGLARYIMSWYRYGKILLPTTVGVEEMKRECAFYQLPDDVVIQRESAGTAVKEAAELMTEARQKAAAAFLDLKRRAMAAAIVDELIKETSVQLQGEAEIDAKEEKDHILEKMCFFEHDSAEITRLASEMAQPMGFDVTSDPWNVFRLKRRRCL